LGPRYLYLDEDYCHVCEMSTNICSVIKTFFCNVLALEAEQFCNCKGKKQPKKSVHQLTGA